MKEKTFRSVDEIKKFYCPEAHERERIAKMTPEEFGRNLAQELLGMIRDTLKG